MPWITSTEVTESGRVCSKCKQFKPWGEYQGSKGQHQGKKPSCKECLNADRRDYYIRNREKVLARTRAYSKTEYRRAYCRERMRRVLRKTRDAMASRPRPDRCEICGALGSENAKGIVYDHCHKTDRFRGWLCNRCNRALGLVQDDITILHAMVAYLRKFNADSQR